ncbi:response regulator [Deinococcus hohokamensis]|uniref:Response regulator n=1 Tax=Deinococcus hohokamensis TaxID=309883 RepID=A0ABV9I7J2_9DEIO
MPSTSKDSRVGQAAYGAAVPGLALRCSGRAASSPLKVLLIDDTSGDLLLAEEAFSAHATDVHVTSFTAGADALSALFDPDQAPPDVVLCDLNMPGLSGVDVLRAIKADADLACIPVVIWSTSDHPADVAQVYAGGASAYLVKGGTLSAVEVQVRAFVHFWQAVARTRTAA